LSADGDTRQRLSERVDEAYLTLRIQKSKGKTVDWAAANIQLAEALTALAIEEDDREAFDRYEQAIAAYHQALEVLDAKDHLGDWGGAIVSFARALRSYAAREGGHMSLLRLEHAESLLNDVINAMPEKEGLFDCAMLHIELAHVSRTQANIDREETRLGHLHAVAAHFKEAARILRMKENFDNWAVAVVGQATAWRDIAAVKRADGLAELYKARDLLKTILNYYNPKTHPIDWVFSNFEHGRIWLRIAVYHQGESCHEAAHQAISAFRTALKGVVVEHAPDLWGRLNSELALALTTLASVSEPIEAKRSVEEATDLYRLLIGWYEMQGDIISAAMMQANLGKELGKLASLSDDEEITNYRMQAVAALRRSVPSLLRQEMPDEWLTNMFELSAALHSLTYHHEPDEVEKLREEAVHIYRNTIKHMDGEKNSAACAMVQTWLGLCLVALGEDDDSETGTNRLREAELCFRQALTLRNEKEDSSDIIRLENNLGHLFYTLARRSDETQAKDYCEQALRSIRRAKLLAQPQHHPAEWCNIRSNEAMILLHRVRRNLSSDLEQECEQGRQAFQDSIEAAKGQIGIVSQLFLRRNLALLLSLWIRNAPPQKAYVLCGEALGLLDEIAEMIDSHGIKDMSDLVIEEDRQELESTLDSLRPRQGLDAFMTKLRLFFLKSTTPKTGGGK